MTYAIIGASAGVGRALASAFAAAGHDLVLVSSDERDLRALTSDLAIRHGARVTAIAADVNDGDGYLDRVAAAVRTLGALDGMLFPLGATDEGGQGSRLTGWPASAHGSVEHVNLERRAGLGEPDRVARGYRCRD